MEVSQPEHFVLVDLVAGLHRGYNMGTLPGSLCARILNRRYPHNGENWQYTVHLDTDAVQCGTSTVWKTGAGSVVVFARQHVTEEDLNLHNQVYRILWEGHKAQLIVQGKSINDSIIEDYPETFYRNGEPVGTAHIRCRVIAAVDLGDRIDYLLLYAEDLQELIARCGWTVTNNLKLHTDETRAELARLESLPYVEGAFSPYGSQEALEWWKARRFHSRPGFGA